MFVLQRWKGQEVEIDGDRIRVKVLEVSGTMVRLGFIAAKDVRIRRAESAPGALPKGSCAENEEAPS